MLLRGALCVVLAWFGLCALGLLYLRVGPPLSTTVHLQRRLEAAFAARAYTKRYAFVPLGRISDHLEHAVVAAEDGRFFAHHGIDWREFRRAMHENWRRRRWWRGGSTITQQLVKNLFLTTHQSLVRKGLEVPLALLAERVLSKQRILELYLNVIEWGPGVYGAEAAARYHYGVPAAGLGREQAARLAACIPAPRSRSPRRMDRAAARILARMARAGW